MKRTFNIVIERDNESTWLVAELESNIKEAIRAYLLTADPLEPLPDFIGTWRVEVMV